MADPTTSQLIALCERVLAADISPEELQRLWPQEPEHPHLAELRETLFSGLEHLPGIRGSGSWQLDRQAWRATSEYGDIEFYLGRLREAADQQ